MEIKPPSAMKLEGNLAQNWHKFKQRFLLYLEATEKMKKPDKQKIALLLGVMGEDCIDIFNSFKLNPEEVDTFEIVMNKFENYFEPKKNTLMMHYNFFNTVQQQGESIDTFVTNLKNLAKDCSFGDQEESLVRDLLIIGVKDLAVKETLLMKSDVSLSKAIDYCRAKEASEIQVKIINEGSTRAEINYVKNFRSKTSIGPKQKLKKENYEVHRRLSGCAKSINVCSKCNTSHQYGRCPAFGKRCFKCNKLNHFSSTCKSNEINVVQNTDDEAESSEEDLSILESIVCNVSSVKLEWKESVLINGKKVYFKIDTGAEVNILPVNKFHDVCVKETLFKAQKCLKSYTGHSLKVLGICEMKCQIGNRSEILEFYVVDHEANALLGLEACEKLGFITRNASHEINTVDSTDFFKRYSDVFTGTLGTLPYTYSIKLDKKAEPRVAASRVIPYALKHKVKEEIDKLVKKGILVHVTEPTDWVHPIVIVRKPNNNVRICMDPRALNKYIKREHYPIPTQQSIFAELEGAQYFTVLDASSAFLQIPLTEESSKLCTVATPFGRFRFTRLPFGIASAPEVFQKTINKVFSGLEGNLVYIDDILVYGRTQEEHDMRLKAVLERAQQHNLRLSKEKSKIRVKSVEYLGFILSSNGLAVNADKIKAIMEYKIPENKTELQRFLGMITYLGKFIQNLSSKTGILRKLLSEKNEFIWSANEQTVFDDLKNCVISAPVLAFFNPNKKSVISVDASQYGLGGVLLQDDHPIAFASVALTDCQQRYSQIEKELLAVVNGCKKFHYYIYGSRFTIETDHKPLIGLLKKPIEKLSPRLQRMVLELFKYQFNLVHVPGKKLYVADALSRCPIDAQMDTTFLETATVHTILTTSQGKTVELQEASRTDPEIIKLKNYILEGWPSRIQYLDSGLRPYWDIKSELHTDQDLVFLGNRLIIPTTMRCEVLSKLHIAHQGITSCQRKAKNTVYWPNLMDDIKKLVSCCRVCQKYQHANTKQPLMPYPVPYLLWEDVGTDFMYLNGEDYLLLIDYHSKFIETRKLNSKTSEPVIKALKQIFRTHGIPKVLHSDNGPPYDSRQFAKFISQYEMKHVTSSPKFARSNGMVERAIETTKLMLRKVIEDHKDPNLALIEYNNTPKYNLPSPSQMLMGRCLRSLIPTKLDYLKPIFPTSKTHQHLLENQKVQKKYHNKSTSQLQPLMPQQKIYIEKGHREWIPGTVIRKHEAPRSYIVKTSSGQELRRNRIHLRPRIGSDDMMILDSPKTDSQLHEQLPQTPNSPQLGTCLSKSPQSHSNPETGGKESPYVHPKRNITRPIKYKDYV